MLCEHIIKICFTASPEKFRSYENYRIQQRNIGDAYELNEQKILVLITKLIPQRIIRKRRIIKFNKRMSNNLYFLSGMSIVSIHFKQLHFILKRFPCFIFSGLSLSKHCQHKTFVVQFSLKINIWICSLW